MKKRIRKIELVDPNILINAIFMTAIAHANNPDRNDKLNAFGFKPEIKRITLDELPDDILDELLDIAVTHENFEFAVQLRDTINLKKNQNA